MSSPAETVTFLFTDIEGSTRLWEKYPDAMRQALMRHDALADEIIRAHNGTLVKSRGEGDSLFVVFPTPLDGVQCACAIQVAFDAEPWVGSLKLRARMSLHAGEAQFRGGDYYGPTINRCARLRAIGHGGQVLISQSIYEGIGGAAPEGTILLDMGAHRLKDLNQPEHVWQVGPVALPQDFPALNSLYTSLHNLPVQTSSFVGRDKELAEIKALLAQTPVLTLLGPGGAGKSRLALQAAADVLDGAGDGVWLVELAAVADAGLVPARVASVLGIQEEPGKPISETLTQALKQKALLILLDNCEHLVGACARLAEAISHNCPKIKILASSRERLGIEGERTYPVSSLALPPARAAGKPWTAPEIDALMQYGGVRLFCERAGQQMPSFTLTPANAESVVEICRRLDGIPLALELAAARIRSLPVPQILARLDDRFKLLKGGSRTALPRQQTLQALIDWSYDLLTAPEKTLLQRLSVFAGGWTLEAAEWVASDDAAVELNAGAWLEEEFLLDILTSLVDKSLVVYVEQEGEGRYRLLETIRQYAAEKLAATAHTGWDRSRYINYFQYLAEEAEPHLQGPKQAEWLARLETEHDNLNAALAYCLPDTDNAFEGGAKQGLLLCKHLWWFWLVRGFFREGRNWLERALRANSEPDKVRSNVLGGLGNLAYRQHDYAAAEHAFTESLNLSRQMEDRRGTAVTLINLGNVYLARADYTGAERTYGEAVTILDPDNSELLSEAWNNLGFAAYSLGNLAQARKWYHAGLAGLRAKGDDRGTSVALYNLAELALEERDYPAAYGLLRECLVLAQTLGARWVLTYALRGMAMLAQALLQWEAVVCLWAAAESLRETLETELTPEEIQVRDTAAEQAGAVLDTQALLRNKTRGATMTPEEAGAYAIDLLDPAGLPAPVR